MVSEKGTLQTIKFERAFFAYQNNASPDSNALTHENSPSAPPHGPSESPSYGMTLCSNQPEITLPLRFVLHLPHTALFHRPAYIRKGVAKPLERVCHTAAVFLRALIRACIFGFQQHAQPRQRVTLNPTRRLIGRIACNAASCKLLLNAGRAKPLAAKQLICKALRIGFIVDKPSSTMRAAAACAASRLNPLRMSLPASSRSQ